VDDGAVGGHHDRRIGQGVQRPPVGGRPGHGRRSARPAADAARWRTAS
jgi:hypothetical protein